MPKVSVVMPAYNAQNYIKAAIDSILNQTFRDFELIVLNDCSRDDTEQVILSCEDPRLVYVKNEKNMGVAATLNRGLELAKGEYIARMDADDISLPARLEKQAAYLDSHPDVAVLGTNVETFDETGPLYTGWSATDPKQMQVDLLFSCGLAHPSVMMRADVIRQLGGYDSAYEGLEDYQLWCRVAEKHGVTTLPDILFRYRIHSGQVTKNPSPAHMQRRRSLKIWQLRQLGITPEGLGAENFCCEKRPETKEEILAAAQFYETVLSANRSACLYDPKLLENAFRGILLAATGALRASDRKAVCRETPLVDGQSLRRYRIKRQLRRLLGR